MSTPPVTHQIDSDSSPIRCKGCDKLWPCQGHNDAERERIRRSAARVERDEKRRARQSGRAV